MNAVPHTITAAPATPCRAMPGMGAWLFAVHWPGQAVRQIAKTGRSQADALARLIDQDLRGAPEVSRIDCLALAPVAPLFVGMEGAA